MKGGTIGLTTTGSLVIADLCISPCPPVLQLYLQKVPSAAEALSAVMGCRAVRKTLVLSENLVLVLGPNAVTERWPQGFKQ